MNWLTAFLPPWLSPTFLGAVAIAIVAGGAGAYIDHKIMMGVVNSVRLETTAVQSRYDGYKAEVAAAAARETARTQAESLALQRRADELQAQLLESQRITDEKSKALRALLASAKPGDMRALGPVAGAYYDRLRGP